MVRPHRRSAHLSLSRHGPSAPPSLPDRSRHQVWSFSDDYDNYAISTGETRRLQSGNTLHNYGTDATVKEVTPSGELVWALTWASDQLLDPGMLLGDLYDLLPADPFHS